MKHLFGRVYFKKPFFIGIKLYSKAAVVAGNILLAIATVAIIYLLVRNFHR